MRYQKLGLETAGTPTKDNPYFSDSKYWIKTKMQYFSLVEINLDILACNEVFIYFYYILVVLNNPKYT